MNPVNIVTKKFQANGISIDYPLIVGVSNLESQNRMNRQISDAVQAMIREHKQSIPSDKIEMTGHFEIKTNERGILSLQLTNYAIGIPSAHGLTLSRSLTFTIDDGKNYLLGELFLPNSNYIQVISTQVKEQIKQRDIPVLEPFEAIKPNQDYYLADKSLVVYFQIYELSPYYVGFPMFPISVYDLQSAALPGGPIDILSADIA